MDGLFLREGQGIKNLQKLEQCLDQVIQEMEDFDMRMKEECNECRLKEMRMERLKLRFRALKYMSEIETINNNP